MSHCPIGGFAGNTEFFSKDGRPLLFCRNSRHTWWRNLPCETEISDYVLVAIVRKCLGLEAGLYQIIQIARDAFRENAKTPILLRSSRPTVIIPRLCRGMITAFRSGR